MRRSEPKPQLELFAAPRPRSTAHHCHAVGCEVAVPPELLMCRVHWAMVPKRLQRAVWAHYRKGQCDDKSPSREWLDAADAAILAVAAAEGKIGRR